MPIYPALDVRAPQIGKAMQLRHEVQRGRAQDERAERKLTLQTEDNAAARALQERRLSNQESAEDRAQTAYDEGKDLREAQLAKLWGELSDAAQKREALDSYSFLEASKTEGGLKTWAKNHPNDPVPPVGTPEFQQLEEAARFAVDSQPPVFQKTGTSGKRQWGIDQFGRKHDLGEKASVKPGSSYNVMFPGETKPRMILPGSEEEKQALEAGAMRTPVSVQATSVEGIGDKVERRKLNERRSSMAAMLTSVNAIKDKVREGGPDVMSLSGAVSRWIDIIAQQAVALTRQLANPGQEPISLREGDYHWSPAMAARSAAYRSNAIALSYLRLRSQDSGNLSRSDVKAGAEQVGADGGSPDQLIAAVDEIARDTIATYSQYHFTIKKEAYDARSDLNAREIPYDSSWFQAPETQGDVSELSDEELSRRYYAQ